MIASSGTVLANLAYLIGAVVLAVIGGLIVWLRHRQPKSVDANMASFRRGLSALAPDAPTDARIRRSNLDRPRPAVTGLTHVRIDPVPAPGTVRFRDDEAGEESARKPPGGRPG